MFWKNWIKIWDPQTPPSPSVGPNSQIFPKIRFEGSPKDDDDDDDDDDTLEKGQTRVQGADWLQPLPHYAPPDHDTRQLS